VGKAHTGQDRLPCWQGRTRAASVRGLNGKELPLESWEQAIDEDWLGQWAMNLMLINVSTDAPGVSASILEGLDEILTVTRLGLPKELRRALACTNIVENVMSTVRRVCRNVKRWRSASMALRWTAAAMQEAAKSLRRLKAHKQLPTLRAALEAHQMKASTHGVLARQVNAA
jgi:transposase-like protein